MKQSLAILDDKNEKLVTLGVDLQTKRSELAREKLGDEGFVQEIQRLEEELAYMVSQIKFYEGGVEASQR